MLARDIVILIIEDFVFCASYPIALWIISDKTKTFNLAAVRTTARRTVEAPILPLHAQWICLDVVISMYHIGWGGAATHFRLWSNEQDDNARGGRIIKVPVRAISAYEKKMCNIKSGKLQTHYVHLQPHADRHYHYCYYVTNYIRHSLECSVMAWEWLTKAIGLLVFGSHSWNDGGKEERRQRQSSWKRLFDKSFKKTQGDMFLKKIQGCKPLLAPCVNRVTVKPISAGLLLTSSKTLMITHKPMASLIFNRE